MTSPEVFGIMLDIKTMSIFLTQAIANTATQHKPALRVVCMRTLSCREGVATMRSTVNTAMIQIEAFTGVLCAVLMVDMSIFNSEAPRETWVDIQ